MLKMTNRFLQYLRFNTQSDEKATSTPSTEGQRIFAEYLAEELRSIGMSDVYVDENSYVTASLPANIGNEALRMKNEECKDDDNSSFFTLHSSFKKVPTIAFIAHLDTSPEMSGENVNPRVVENYDGGDIVLTQPQPQPLSKGKGGSLAQAAPSPVERAGGEVLSPKDFPELKQYIGQDIIVTDGRTLLGADNKAGIAEIVSAMEYLIKNPEIKHCHIRVAFTPDEEIGHGARLLDIERLGADWAYTIDGGALGEIEFENFNAAQAVVKFKGRNLHPGYAKGKMQNSTLRAGEFISALPKNETPAETEGYEGFFHLFSVNGTVEKTTLTYIVRDHDAAKFEERKKLLQELAGKYNAEIEITDQYRNMREQIEPVYHIVERAIKAMERVGVEPKIKPVRGGTDGAQLSFRGLPCPNIFAGGHNFHGRYEFIPVQSMEKAMKVIVEIVAPPSPPEGGDVSLVGQANIAGKLMGNEQKLTSPPSGGLGGALLLHTCCAPCSSAVIEWLLANEIRPTLFFFNPNIFPLEEYEKRKNELTRYAQKLGIEIIDGDYNHALWLEKLTGLEQEPERGKRCLQCFKIRLLATAKLAQERGFSQFATTLASSRWKSLEQINEAGHWAAAHTSPPSGGLGGASFFEKNWRKGGLSERRDILLAENGFYNQTYCGCEFSMNKHFNH